SRAPRRSSRWWPWHGRCWSAAPSTAAGVWPAVERLPSPGALTGPRRVAMHKNILFGLGTAVALVVGFFAGRWSAGGQPAGPGGNDGETHETLKPVHDPDPKETRARVKYLIEMLASKNPAPKITGEMDLRDAIIEYSKEYNDSLQVPVYLALHQLLAEGEA